MKAVLAVIVLIFFVSVADFHAQKNVGKRSPSLEEIRRRAISVGVVNGKAIDLVKPDYPQAARPIRAQGAVNVQVLINEDGKVIEAKALSGHPVLRAGSVAAALKSRFEPVILSGRKLNVWGVIVYNYSTDFFNWLEIGFVFGGNRIPEMLPPGFETEKLLYKQYQDEGFNKESADFQRTLKAIENKISADKKSLWLFQVGMFLNKIQYGFQNKEGLKTVAAELKNYISNTPNDVSPVLLSKLKNLLNSAENSELNTYSPQTGTKFQEQMKEINEKMYLIGN